MIINTTAGKTYAVTPQTDCTVSTPDGVLIASCPAGGQTCFIAPCAEVEVSDDSALVTESFKGALGGSSASGGSGHFDSVTVTGNATVQGGLKIGPKGAWIKGVTDREIGMDILTVYTNASVNNLYNTGKGVFSGPATFNAGVTMGQTLTVEGQTILTGGLHVEGDLALYGADGLPGGHVCGYYGSPDESTIIIKDADAREYMSIGYNANTAQASLNLRGDATSLALPGKLVGPVQFYDQDLNYVVFGITYDAATGWHAGTDFRFNAYGGMDVASGAVFHSGVTMEQSLNVAGEAILKRLAVYGDQYSVFTVETARATWTNAQTGYFRLASDNKGEKEVVLELGNGQSGNKARFIKPSQSSALTEIDVPNSQEGDARWVKFNNTLTDAQYAALAVKDQTTLYITDTGKIYLGSYALN